MPETKIVNKITRSANKSFNYDDEFYGYKLSELAQEAHRELSILSGWYYRQLVPGQFGYDNMIVCIGTALKEFKDGDKITSDSEIKLAELIHEGWAINYIYWRDTSPWLKRGYSAPAKKLGDERRNQCAITAFKNLDKEEQDKDLVISRFLIKKLF
jgi:hypothetical protein